jgi:hypothetical protein
MPELTYTCVSEYSAEDLMMRVNTIIESHAEIAERSYMSSGPVSVVNFEFKVSRDSDGHALYVASFFISTQGGEDDFVKFT